MFQQNEVVTLILGIWVLVFFIGRTDIGHFPAWNIVFWGDQTSIDFVRSARIEDRAILHRTVRGEATGYNVDLTHASAESRELDIEVRIGP